MAKKQHRTAQQENHDRGQMKNPPQKKKDKHQVLTFYSWIEWTQVLTMQIK